MLCRHEPHSASQPCCTLVCSSIIVVYTTVVLSAGTLLDTYEPQTHPVSLT